MDKEKAEETHSGIQLEGEWDEICDFARKLESVLKDSSYQKKKEAGEEAEEEYEESVEDYHNWRPREEEDKKDISKKTAKEATVEEQEVEENFNGTDEELQKAGEKMKESIESATEEDKSAPKELKDASKCLNRLVGAKSIESIRKLERTIYEKIMLKFNPYYFDTEHFSVNLEEIDENKYMLTINIPDEKLRDKIREGFGK